MAQCPWERGQLARMFANGINAGKLPALPEAFSHKIGLTNSYMQVVSDALSKANVCALRLLARREHSRLELQQKLVLRHFPLDIIDNVLETLATQDWQSDQRFAEMYVRSRIERGDGGVKIQMKLGEFGISDDIISQTLPQDEQFWQHHLACKWGKKYLVATDNIATRAKQVRFLQARGFTWDQIKAAQKIII